MHCTTEQNEYSKNGINRRKMFDRRQYKHVGWYICDDPELEIDITSVNGVRELLDCCMLRPYTKYDCRRGLFLLAEFYELSNKSLSLVVTTYERYDAGFVENEEIYNLKPSNRIFNEIDDSIDKEWKALLCRAE